MKKVRWFLLCVVVIALCAFWWFAEFWPQQSNRYRFEVSFEVEGKPVSGSVVQELTVSGSPIVLNVGGHISYAVRGQALPVEIPGYGTVFVTMQRYCKNQVSRFECAPGYGTIVRDACRIQSVPGNYRSYVKKYKDLDGECPVNQENLPVIVRFIDEGDQESAREVKLDNTGAIEGIPVRFLNAKIEFTNDPVTTDLEQRLQWLVDPVTRFSPTVKAEDGSEIPYFPYLSFLRR